MAWWILPLVATLAAWAYTRLAVGRGRVRPRPEPGSAQDAAELARLARALGEPLPRERR